jgi:23S rRNA pseudoU1915 N3-methylase RlmH
MSKAPTTRQIDTVRSELRKGIDNVVNAWRQNEPYPCWAVEEEWEQENISPRRRHRKQEEELRSQLQKQADELLLRINLGAVETEDLHAELLTVLRCLDARKTSFIGAGK